MLTKKPTVYTKLINYIETEIELEHLTTGNRIPGENALARQFNISRASVRKGIKSLIDKQCLISIQGKGVFVTSPDEIRQKKVYHIGLVSKSVSSNAVTYLGIQHMLCEHFFSAHFKVRLLPVPLSADSFLKNPGIGDLDGFLWLFPNNNSYSVIEELFLKLKKHFLLFDRHIPHAPDLIPAALFDEALAMRQALTLLLNYGHRNILFFHMGREQYSLRRINLFKGAMNYNKMSLNSDNIIDIENEPGYAPKIADLIIERKPDAVFFAQGAISQAILPHLYGRGIKLPEDLSVITFDRIENPYDMVITCIDSDFEKLAAMTAKYVIAKLQQADADIPAPRLRSDLIMGDSCAPLEYHS
ncbi:MAG: substrate-binding domain-containing protein [Victivallaceae bacterium]|nr:substrate-binding domain-containing protein [Victivallaceae bacterium]